jgi:Cdc6-like AAA superfamily ATPase
MTVIIIIGKRGRGKTSIAKRYINADNVTVIETKHYFSFDYSDIKCKLLQIYQDLDYTILERFYAHQEKNKNESGCLVLDNCIFDNKWHTNPIIEKLFANTHVLKTTLIITMPLHLEIPLHLKKYTSQIIDLNYMSKL